MPRFAYLFTVLLLGCAAKEQTTVRTYQPDGKTLASETRVNLFQEVVFPNGMRVQPADNVVTATQVIMLKGFEIGGNAFANRVLDKAAESATAGTVAGQ